MPVTPTIEVDDTLKERSSHGSFELPIETYTDNLPFPLQPLA